jgi:choline dehydrogenase-like flavoprotein
LRIIFDNKKAIGVEYERGDQTVRADSNKGVILSAGAFGSPNYYYFQA